MSSEKPIRIRRASHSEENPYFQHSRATAQDKNLSYEARGMLAYLLSKPSDWVVQPRDLQGKGAGRDKVYNILNELIAHCYILRETIRNKGVVTGVEYMVFERPYTTDSPFPEKPDTASPDTANTDSTYKREEHNKDSKTPRKRDPFFDVLARDFFGVDLDDKAAVGLVASRISGIKKRLTAADSGLTAEELFEVARWLAETRAGLSMPQSDQTIGTAIVDYRNRDKHTSAGRFDNYVDHPDQDLFPGVKIPRTQADEIVKRSKENEQW